LKILNIDVETSPAQAYIWDLKTRYVRADQLIQPKRLLCFAAKWVGEPKVWFYSRWHDGLPVMTTRVRDLLDQADAVLTYNGTRFDEPVINTEIVTFGLAPYSPAKRVDLYQTITRRFAFMSNSLGYVSHALGLDGKMPHAGFELWRKVLAGDVEARKTMRLYNIQDVHANEDLYRRVLPWIVSHPSIAVHTGQEICPTCGSSRIQRRGYAYTQVSVFQRFACLDCGRWSRSGKRIDHVDIREVAA
jgi:uncharacterized protein